MHYTLWMIHTTRAHTHDSPATCCRFSNGTVNAERGTRESIGALGMTKAPMPTCRPPALVIPPVGKDHLVEVRRDRHESRRFAVGDTMKVRDDRGDRHQSQRLAFGDTMKVGDDRGDRHQSRRPAFDGDTTWRTIRGECS